MRLNFSLLSASSKKSVGQVGQGGTLNVYKAESCPTNANKTWGTVGQIALSMVESNVESIEIVKMSHLVQTEVGQITPSVYKDVPLVPHVPPKNRENRSVECEEIILRYCPGLSVHPKVIIENLLSVEDEQDLINGLVDTASLRLHIELWCAVGMPHLSGKLFA